MAELPKIVRERLRDQTVGSDHPDANLLSSFAEHVLTEPERVPLLEHLSRCAQCREIVALSTPEVEQEMQVAAARTPDVARRSWWRSPVLHWSALTAAALVVLIAVGERMQLREKRSASAPAIRYEAAPLPNPAPEVAPSVPQSTEAPPELKQPAKQTTKTPVPHQTFDSLNARDAVSRGTIVSADKMATLGGASAGATAKVAAPPAPPPAALPMKPHGNADAGKTNGPLIESGNYQDSVMAVPSTSETVTVEATAPARSSSQHQTMLREKALAKSAVVGPRWSISGAGALQRSLDGGRSWNQVAVTDGVTFRALSVVGKDIWVGGSGGALFHSADGGEHWSRVRVEVNDRALSGDIVGIEFPDAAHGAISTSTGHTWRTLDAGATWQVQ